MDFTAATVKVMRVERGEASKPTTSQKKYIPASPTFVNIPNSDKSRMEEIKRLQEELEQTKALLTIERARALEIPFPSANFNSPSPLFFDTRNIVTTTTTTMTSSTTTPNRSPAMPSRIPSGLSSSTSKLQAIQENTAINTPKPHSISYRTFSPTVLANAYLDHLQREPSPKLQLSSHPPSTPVFHSPQSTLLPTQSQHSENSQIMTPQPRYPPQPLLIESDLLFPSPSPHTSNSSESSNSFGFNTRSSPSLDLSSNSNNSTKQDIGLSGSNGINSKVLRDFNVVSSVTSTNSTAVFSSVKSLNTSTGISKVQLMFEIFFLSTNNE
jgi:hypothetical protein